ncbi:hypothetical protein B0H03_1169 [Rathayibacter iranicus NCPPB 2253 = VKM Ac-1602]|uniref:Uncharacterized protein n=1 Tax=Rathayibacter iranicus NCPPB 2253 = VKM Ac-1602 TaxID=1328868 RepID=A0ABX5L9U5_9MICO|nr:hypothetical protein B0H03_1169 [Rathayibacter iranicus NCPPB 2253 = VKM Ac-1602]
MVRRTRMPWLVLTSDGPGSCAHGRFLHTRCSQGWFFFHRQQVVSAGRDDVCCGIALGVHRVRGDDNTLQGEAVQQLAQHRDLLAFRGRLNLPEHRL